MAARHSEALAERLDKLRVELADEGLEFVRHDNAMNAQLLRIMTTVSQYIENDPDILATGDDRAALAAAIRGAEAGDIAGAGGISDIIDLVGGLLNPLKSEKDFFLQIIRLVFCGCDHQ